MNERNAEVDELSGNRNEGGEAMRKYLEVVKEFVQEEDAVGVVEIILILVENWSILKKLVYCVYYVKDR